MQLTEIYELLQTAEKTGKKVEDDFARFTPEKIEQYELPEFKIPAGRKSKRALYAKVRAMLNYTQRIRYKDACTQIALPTTNKQFLSICGNPKEVKRMLGLMTEIGIIQDAHTQYRFGCKESVAKTYFYFYENEQRFIKYCEDEQITAKTNVPNSVLHITPIPTNLPFSYDKVRISSDLSLLCLDDMSKDRFEKILSCLLYENYTFLDYYMNMLEKVNEFYKDTPELQHIFQPNYHWVNRKKNRYITKIGIRDTNALCGLPSEEVKKDKNGKIIKVYPINRKKTRRELGLNLEYDVKSSVPRLTMSLNYGYWIPEEVDLYKLMFDNYGTDEDFNRDAIKSLFMSAYFDEESKIGKNVFFRMQDNREKVNYSEVKYTMQQFKEAVLKTLGGSFGSEIFLYESCIYLQVSYELLKRGYFVWQVYDGFYSRKAGVSQEEYSALCKQLVEEAFNDFLDRFLE